MTWMDNLTSGGIADQGFGTAGAVGSGGFNFIDAQAGNPAPSNSSSLFGSDPFKVFAQNTPGSTPSGGSTSSGVFGTGLTGKELTSLGGAAVAGGALAYNLSQGDKVDPNVSSLQQLVGTLGPQAAAQFAQGNQYMSYLAAGTLPQGLENEVQAQRKSAQARYLQNAASSGLAADPRQNSALAADLNATDEAMVAHRAQLGTQLLSAGNTMISNGINISGMEANTFKYLADYDMKKSQQTGSAISAFAAALGSIGGAFLGGPAGAAAGGAAGKALGGAIQSS